MIEHEMNELHARAAMDPDPVDAENEAIMARAKLLTLIGKLSVKRDKCIKDKRPIEDRWIDSMRQYYGKPARSGGGPDQEVPRPRMTRSRADRWEARLCDMLFPANELPWDLAPTPDLGEVVDELGNPLTPAEARAREGASAARMKRAIEDQLANCRFHRSGRRMIRDAVRIGCGLLMGPAASIQTKRKFRQAGGMSVLTIEEKTVPEIREADPWCFFPDMTETIERSEFAFYVHLLSALEVRALAPGFDQEAIGRLLAQEPDLGELTANLAARNRGLEQSIPTSDRYAVWRYTGALTSEELEVLGVLPDEGEETLPAVAMADLWFCQDEVLRVELSPIASDYRIPYFIFSPFPCDGTMFGYSVPDLCSDSARVLDSAWAITLHNASLSSGPMFISRQGKLRPRDGKYVIRGPKWFEVTDDNVRLEDAVRVEVVPNCVDEALRIFDRALGIMDEELNTSQWASPDNSEEVPTASGLAMLLNVRSILQVRVATVADDEIFAPVIERMYWWNMLYNPDESIKGDYDVAPLVQSVRLVRDVQIQHLQALTALTSDPRFAPFIDDYELLRANVGMMDFPSQSFILEREEAERRMAEMPPPPDVLLAQARAESEQARALLMQAQAAAEERDASVKELLAELKARGLEAEISRDEAKGALDIASRQVHHDELMRSMDIREREADVRVQVAEIRRDTELARLAEASRCKDAGREADAAAKQAEARSKLIAKGMDIERDAREMALKERMGSGI